VSDDASLRQSRALLEKLFRNSPAAIGLVRLSDGVLVDINEAYERLFGWTREEVLGRSTPDLRIWVDAEERSRFRERLLSAGRVVDFESRARRKSGEIFDSLMSSEILEHAGERLALVIVVDVSSRKRELESRALLGAVVESSSDAIVVSDADMRIVSWSGGAERMFGWSPAEAVGRELSLIVPPDRWQETLGNTERMRRGEAAPTFETVRATKDGRLLDVQISVSGVYEGGRLKRVAGIFRDITARKRDEQRLRQFNVELEKKVVERTEALDAANRELEAFSYSVSHDLRAPLRAIDGFAGLLEERCRERLDPESREYLQQMRASVERMNRLIGDLLAFSQAGRAELRKRLVDVSALAREISAELARADPRRRVAWEIAEGLRAYADPGLARVVFENLLGNAWKYTGKNAEARIEVGLAEGGEIFVRDNGIGFDPAHAENLFQPFRRLQGAQAFEGTGVGLATVARIVARHGGRVRAEGAPGRGAVFSFRLSPGDAPAAG
jgi:PAS domain S-box-containing protein